MKGAEKQFAQELDGFVTLNSVFKTYSKSEEKKVCLLIFLCCKYYAKDFMRSWEVYQLWEVFVMSVLFLSSVKNIGVNWPISSQSISLKSSLFDKQVISGVCYKLKPS